MNRQWINKGDHYKHCDGQYEIHKGPRGKWIVDSWVVHCPDGSTIATPSFFEAKCKVLELQESHVLDTIE